MKVIVVDLDGTIACDTHRQHHITVVPGELLAEPDWDGYFANMIEDPVIEPMLAIVRAMQKADHLVYIVTGRRDSVREQTVEWLKKHNIDFNRLYMRRSGDQRPNAEIKLDCCRAIRCEGHEIVVVLEDTESVANTLRKDGFFVVRGIENHW